MSPHRSATGSKKLLRRYPAFGLNVEQPLEPSSIYNRAVRPIFDPHRDIAHIDSLPVDAARHTPLQTVAGYSIPRGAQSGAIPFFEFGFLQSDSLLGYNDYVDRHFLNLAPDGQFEPIL